MKTRTPISADQYFRELEAMARLKEIRQKINGQDNILDFMEARRRLRPSEISRTFKRAPST